MADLNESPSTDDDAEGHAVAADDASDQHEGDDVEGHVFIRHQEREGEGRRE